MEHTKKSQNPVENWLKKVAERETMEKYFDFLTGLTNVDAVREAFLFKTEELIKEFLK